MDEHRALREIVEGTAAETGEPFFDALVMHLARALGTRFAWVTEWLPEERRLRALSFWDTETGYREYEYDVVGTPCEPVIDNREMACFPERVIELFPDDPDLEGLGAVSYMGMPLLDTDGTLLGHLAVIHTAPLVEGPAVTAIFRIFAGRAAAEQRRLRREQAIREREEKLSRLIDSAMDAIVELDENLTVTDVNRAGRRLFAAGRDQLVGTSLAALLDGESWGRLQYLARQLDERPADDRSLWVHGGLDGTRSEGGKLQLEATLSRFQLEGRRYHTLILRDINDRLEAEERIRSLTDRTAYLQAEIESLHGFDEIIGTSDALRTVLAQVGRVADSGSAVLITGETGTGKELIARAIHDRSGRAEGPLITVNCAAVPQHLQESEFFGHERGAFTGATERRSGRFKLADGGTIFLDEVGELPLDLQAKLLRVLQEGELQPVGSSRSETVDVRVISATNRDLRAMVDAGTFREDLLYRLEVFPIHVPPLRERGDDVLLLAEAFLRRLGGRRPGPAPVLDDAAREALRGYRWPGNVRELRNVIERAVILSGDGGRLQVDLALRGERHQRADAATASAEPGILTDEQIRALERDNMRRVLEQVGWKISGPGGAAERLGLNPSTLRSRMKALRIRRSRRAES